MSEISLQPSWADCMRIYVLAINNGHNAEAEAEIIRGGVIIDRLTQRVKELEELIASGDMWTEDEIVETVEEMYSYLYEDAGVMDLENFKPDILEWNTEWSSIMNDDSKEERVRAQEDYVRKIVDKFLAEQ